MATMKEFAIEQFDGYRKLGEYFYKNMVEVIKMGDGTGKEIEELVEMVFLRKERTDEDSVLLEKIIHWDGIGDQLESGALMNFVYEFMHEDYERFVSSCKQLKSHNDIVVCALYELLTDGEIDSWTALSMARKIKIKKSWDFIIENLEDYDSNTDVTISNDIAAYFDMGVDENTEYLEEEYGTPNEIKTFGYSLDECLLACAIKDYVRKNKE